MNQSVVGDLNDRQWGITSEASIDVGGGTVRLINSYRDWDNYQLDGDVVYLPLPLLSRVGESTPKSQNHELQYFSPVDEWLRAPEVLTLPSIDDDRFTYRIGLNYKPREDVMLFASYSTGYKSGGYNSGGGTPSLTTFGPTGAVVLTKRVFDRETVKNYELGIKASWLDRALTTNLTLYRMVINGYQDRSFDGVSAYARRRARRRCRHTQHRHG